MISCILFFGQIPSAHHSNRHCVPKHHLNGRRRNWRQIKRTQLPLNRQMHIHITNIRKRITLNRRHRHQIRTLSLGARDDSQQLLRVSALTKQNQNVLIVQDPDIAVKGVDRVEKTGLDTERDQCLGDFVGDESGLADTCEKDCAPTFEEGLGERQSLRQGKMSKEVVKVVLLGFEKV